VFFCSSRRRHTRFSRDWSSDVCSSDLVYGPLAAGASIFMYEGAPTYPAADRFWAMIERHRITVLYTAPTAIRAFMRSSEDLPKRSEERRVGEEREHETRRGARQTELA